MRGKIEGVIWAEGCEERKHNVSSVSLACKLGVQRCSTIPPEARCYASRKAFRRDGAADQMRMPKTLWQRKGKVEKEHG